MLDDHGAAQRTAAIAHQVFEDAEFLGRKLDVFAGAGYFAADAIERELAYLEAFRGRLAAAEQDADAGQEFDEGEGLDEVIVGAAFEAFHAIVDGVAGAEDQHGRAGFAIANLLERAQAVHIGEAEVEDNQVVFGIVDQLNGGVGAVIGDIDRIASAFEAPGEEIGNSFFVLDDENSHIVECTRSLRCWCG